MTERTAEMAAYDALPRKLRAVLRELPVDVRPSNVADCLQRFGMARTLAALQDIAEHPP